MYIVFKKPIINTLNELNCISTFSRNDLFILKLEKKYNPGNYANFSTKYLSGIHHSDLEDAVSIKKISVNNNSELIIEESILPGYIQRLPFMRRSIMNYLQILLDNDVIELKENLTIEDFEIHKKSTSYKIDNKLEMYKDFVENLKIQCITHSSIIVKGVKKNEITNKEEPFTLKEVEVTRTHHSFRQSNMSALSDHNIWDKGYLYGYSNTKDYFIFKEQLLNICNTSISCGVTQLYNIDNFTIFCNEIEDNELQKLLIQKIQDCLKKVSPGSALIYSTTKRVLKKNKYIFKQLTENLASTTRYTKNENSGNKIGTTILILN